MTASRLCFIVAALAAVACASRLRKDASTLQEGEDASGAVAGSDHVLCNELTKGCTWLAAPCCKACVCTDKTYTHCKRVRTTCKGKSKSLLSAALFGGAQCDYMYSFDAATHPVFKPDLANEKSVCPEPLEADADGTPTQSKKTSKGKH